ncbi:hypothetical protein GCM10009557_69780 [Virgisporangium ochraceum]|uniref:Hsp70 family protein n=1 Tax=Virgisporangium ochraceum TaxID=65505 RepID=A0A8J4A1L4_9ACTN|nr:hypothetical protein [Virgisporangium ochraceum]GIJ72180.1 hypothetical protein Voc01_070970 [Virgisporangium ochraceum]
MSEHRLAIDYGTSNTVAVMRRPDSSVRPLLPPATGGEIYAALSR